MRFGLFVPATDTGTRIYPIEHVTSRIEHAECLGFDSAWVADHFFFEGTPFGRSGGYDPLIQLTHAAARTRRIGLGTLVLGGPFRPVWQVAREAVALADASGGRYILGIGAGWYRPEFDALGLPFDHLVSRFEQQVEALRPLIAGERVSHTGRDLRLDEAQIISRVPAPPLWVAGSGPRVLRLAARRADGWNLVPPARLDWRAPDPGWIVEPLERLRREVEQAGREPQAITVSAGVSVLAESSDSEIVAMARAYAQVGIDLLILLLGPSPGSPEPPGLMERVSKALELV